MSSPTSSGLPHFITLVEEKKKDECSKLRGLLTLSAALEVRIQLKQLCFWVMRAKSEPTCPILDAWITGGQV